MTMSDNFYSLQTNTITNYSQGADYDVVNTIRSSGTQKEQLKKVAKEFEAILVSKMLTQMDKTVDRENSMFGDSKYMDNFKSILFNQIGRDVKYMDNFKSILFNQIGRDVANSPTSNIGFAKQLYQQMEKTVPDENVTTKDILG